MSDYQSTHQSAMSIEEPRDAGEEGGLHRPQARDLAPRGFGLHLQKDDQDGQVDQDVQGGQYDQDCQYVLADQDGQKNQYDQYDHNGADDRRQSQYNGTGCLADSLHLFSQYKTKYIVLKRQRPRV